MRNCYRSCRHVVAWLAIGVGMAGCAVPEHQRVRDGVEPEHVDTDVRFRTTYFFRVFDFCPPLRRDYAEGASGIGSGASTSRAPADEVFSPGTSRLLILTDSLYRFRMTGKANALTTQIHFESGTLRASEIDPFGSNVEFDEENRSFYHVSAREAKRRAMDSQELARIRTAVGETESALLRLLDKRRVLDPQSDVSEIGTLQKLIDKKTVTLEALVDREHALLLGTSALKVGTSASVPDAVLAAIQLEERAAEMATLFDEDVEDQRTIAADLKGPLEVQALAKMDSAPDFGRSMRVALEDLLRAAEDKVKQLEEAQAALKDLRDAQEKRANEEGIPLDDDSAYQTMKGKVEKAQAILTLGRRLAETLAGVAVSYAAHRANASPDDGITGSGVPEQIACEDGTPARRGFQIMGPEGWRTFDQDERLLMAMSTSAKPLVGVIKDLASRTNAQATSESERQLPFAIERIRVLETEKRLNRASTSTPEDADALLELAVETFKNPERQ